MIVDAAFLERRLRDRFRHLAESMNVPFLIVDCQAPVDVLRARVAERERRGRDPSEANLAVLEHQLATHEPLEVEEQPSVIGFGYRKPADSNAFDRSYRFLKTRINQT
ncbi:MAG TPA: ATP-binding protein [Burkholderiales bacterium]|nr:ATP-binding protein [Burkholderiales bacterium]